MVKQIKLLIPLLSIMVINPSVASDNKANDYLMTLTPKGQAEMLARVSGVGCKGKTAFYQGSIGEHVRKPGDLPPLKGGEADALWSLKCSNGKSYSLLVHPKGDGSVMSCKELEAMHGGHCFVKY